MNKELAIEAMATFVHKSISDRRRDGSKESYVETCTDLYNFMKEQGIIA
jgi:hypothetical protein